MRASERTSERCERTDERVAQYFSLYFWLIWPTVQVKIVNLFREYLVKEIAHKRSSYDLNLKGFKVDFCAKFPEQRNFIGNR